MSKAQTKRETRLDGLNSAAENAKGWLASIEEMLAEQQAEIDNRGASDDDGARRRIEESVLSVQVRSGWYSPGRESREDADPEEYEILLTTGGPGLRIFGRLNEHCEPSSAELQMQDWGTPWTRYPAPEATLLDFARVFWFGE